VAIPSRRITFEPPVVRPGEEKEVVMKVDMTDLPVGIWVGEIVSRQNRGVLMSEVPMMPTWAA
jgi:hypothetical protein